MLYKETIDPDTLGLIRELQSDPFLADFFLVGGTALSLQIGHRISVDIDLFTRKEFDEQKLLEHLEQQYSFELQFMHKQTLKGFIRGVFVDILRHDYPLLRPPLTEDGIAFFSKEDISAMKVNAICGNGTRTKDFVDIYFLLKEFSFGEILDFYKRKYSMRNDVHALKSLTYYGDLAPADWPNLVKETNLTLGKVEKTIIKHRDIFLNEKLR